MAKEKKTIPAIIAENIPEGKKILFEYVRTKGNRKIGLLVSTKKGTVGWSMCKKAARVLIDEFKVTLDEEEIAEERELYGVDNETDVIETMVQKIRITKGDKFDFEIAFKKALKNETRGQAIEIPNSIKERVEAMIERSNRYFK